MMRIKSSLVPRLSLNHHASRTKLLYTASPWLPLALSICLPSAWRALELQGMVMICVRSTLWTPPALTPPPPPIFPSPPLKHLPSWDTSHLKTLALYSRFVSVSLVTRCVDLTCAKLKWSPFICCGGGGGEGSSRGNPPAYLMPRSVSKQTPPSIRDGEGWRPCKL